MARSKTTLKSREAASVEAAEQEYYMRMIEIAIARGEDFPQAMTFANKCVAEQKEHRARQKAREQAARIAARKRAADSK